MAPTSFGLKRCHLINAEGGERRLVPDARSAEGRRARPDHERPTPGRGIRVVSLLPLIVALLFGLPQSVEVVSQVPPIAERFGTFTSPVEPPWWLNAFLALGASTSSVERATRLRWNALLDGGG
ncbi:hypothetical protein [Nocardiopsis sp. MG754419]|uniref:hypothetical protein n=1 Tax=Nocardiopsis sp. MG754419 TaxID=2259865 RepID=UPI0027DB2524|nr:hypothetical protein [Nocardiopsis sp. MG754419]